MSNMEINRLLEKEEKAKKDLRTIEIQLYKLREKIELPKLKAKYEGKYFKFDNGYNQDERWPMYIHIIKVESHHSFLGDTFQKTTREYSFKKRDYIVDSLLTNEITKAEYNREAKKFLSQFPSIQ